MRRFRGSIITVLLPVCAAPVAAQQGPQRAITQVAGDLCRFQDAFHYSVFLVTEDGIPVPGHGPLGTRADVTEHRRYLQALHDAVLEVARAGHSLEEMKRSIALEAFSHLGQYPQWRELNIGGMYRHVSLHRRGNRGGHRPGGPPGTRACHGAGVACASEHGHAHEPPMESLHRIGTRISAAAHQLLFHNIHSRFLIYNACWEDPRIDRALLGLDRDSRVVMLTSAGCNALEYLLDGPAEIHSVDVNPRQNALLQLKLALFRRGSFEDLYAMFGEGSHDGSARVYAGARPHLDESSRRFWDRCIGYFDRRRGRPSFYYHGTAGAVAWLVTRRLVRNRDLRRGLMELLDAPDLEAQRRIYARIEPLLWGPFLSWLVRHPVVMSMLGVPRAQLGIIRSGYPGGIRGYLTDKLRHVATEVLMRDNYFWRVYLTGSYAPGCCPEYLRRDNFQRLRERADRIRTHTATVTDFLRHHPGRYSHFVLLDHQDWLVRHDPAALDEEWELVLANSRPGTRILMRSAAADAGFLPAFAARALRFFPDRAQALHRHDRVGTYASLHLAEVR